MIVWFIGLPGPLGAGAPEEEVGPSKNRSTHFRTAVFSGSLIAISALGTELSLDRVLNMDCKAKRIAVCRCENFLGSTCVSGPTPFAYRAKPTCNGRRLW